MASARSSGSTIADNEGSGVVVAAPLSGAATGADSVVAGAEVASAADAAVASSLAAGAAGAP
ncbi:hypothetical protein AWC28_18820 [Mycolicibacter terrae]|nr:hypothetical protein AWC28_18820 [Mycolicibacter terrae]